MALARDDVERLMKALETAPYRVCEHIVHPDFRNHRRVLASDPVETWVRATCGACGEWLVLVPA